IRDFHVTGVQTCALPISDVLPPVRFDELALVGRSADPMLLGLRARLDPVDDIDRALAHALGELSHGARALGPAATGVATTPSAQIGRASCRESDEMSVVA